MKKLISVLLVTVLVFGLCACSGTKTETPATSVLQVGYGREKIMPDASVPLDGYGNTSLRMSENTLDPLYATCIAFREGDETVLMFSLDLLTPKVDLVEVARKRIMARTGIPEDKIMFCCTHTHSGPDVTSTDAAIQRYKQTFWSAVELAAEQAIADLAPASLYGTKTMTENMTFVRNYIMSDGTYRVKASDDAKGVKAHAAENDPEMLLVKIDREGDKKDILMMNFGGHSTKTGGSTLTDISADYIGSTRMAVERDSDMLFVFFQGAGGNQNTTSKLPGEAYIEDNKEYGEKMSQIALGEVQNLQPISGSGVKTYQLMFEQPVNHDDVDKILEAKQVQSMWYGSGDLAAATALANSLGLNTVYHADAIVARTTRPETDKMEINAIMVGGMAFVTVPFEMFSTTSTYIKANSPFDMTMVCSISNQDFYYLPSAETFDYNPYECNVSYFAKGAAEATADKLLEMLGTLKGE